MTEVELRRFATSSNNAIGGWLTWAQAQNLVDIDNAGVAESLQAADAAGILGPGRAAQITA